MAEPSTARVSAPQQPSSISEDHRHLAFWVCFLTGLLGGFLVPGVHPHLASLLSSLSRDLAITYQTFNMTASLGMALATSLLYHRLTGQPQNAQPGKEKIARIFAPALGSYAARQVYSLA